MQGFSINSSNTFPSNNCHRIVIKFLVVIVTTVMYFLVRIVIIVIKIPSKNPRTCALPPYDKVGELTVRCTAWTKVAAPFC